MHQHQHVVAIGTGDGIEVHQCPCRVITGFDTLAAGEQIATTVAGQAQVLYTDAGNRFVEGEGDHVDRKIARVGNVCKINRRCRRIDNPGDLGTHLHLVADGIEHIVRLDAEYIAAGRVGNAPELGQLPVDGIAGKQVLGVAEQVGAAVTGQRQVVERKSADRLTEGERHHRHARQARCRNLADHNGRRDHVQIPRHRHGLCQGIADGIGDAARHCDRQFVVTAGCCKPSDATQRPHHIVARSQRFTPEQPVNAGVSGQCQVVDVEAGDRLVKHDLDRRHRAGPRAGNRGDAHSRRHRVDVPLLIDVGRCVAGGIAEAAAIERQGVLPGSRGKAVQATERPGQAVAAGQHRSSGQQVGAVVPGQGQVLDLESRDGFVKDNGYCRHRGISRVRINRGDQRARRQRVHDPVDCVTGSQGVAGIVSDASGNKGQREAVLPLDCGQGRQTAERPGLVVRRCQGFGGEQVAAAVELQVQVGNIETDDRLAKNNFQRRHRTVSRVADRRDRHCRRLRIKAPALDVTDLQRNQRQILNPGACRDKLQCVVPLDAGQRCQPAELIVGSGTAQHGGARQQIGAAVPG